MNERRRSTRFQNVTVTGVAVATPALRDDLLPAYVVRAGVSPANTLLNFSTVCMQPAPASYTCRLCSPGGPH